MKSPTQRINNIIGQLEGVKKMIDADSDCFETLTQIKAVKSALQSLTSQYLSTEFTECMNACSSSDREEKCKSFIDELIK